LQSLTYRQHRILVRVSEGHTSLAAIAALGNLTLPTVPESVDGLVRRGLDEARGLHVRSGVGLARE
jgi:DNA-binding MarR family transcriptional regulator